MQEPKRVPPAVTAAQEARILAAFQGNQATREALPRGPGAKLQVLQANPVEARARRERQAQRERQVRRERQGRLAPPVVRQDQARLAPRAG